MECKIYRFYLCNVIIWSWKHCCATLFYFNWNIETIPTFWKFASKNAGLPPFLLEETNQAITTYLMFLIPQRKSLKKIFKSLSKGKNEKMVGPLPIFIDSAWKNQQAITTYIFKKYDHFISFWHGRHYYQFSQNRHTTPYFYFCVSVTFF